jgi:hypothetical protein
MLKQVKLGEDQVQRRWRGEITATKIEKSK